MSQTVQSQKPQAGLHWERARDLMAPNFFGPDEWWHFYAARFSPEKLRMVERLPWNEDELKEPCPFHRKKTVRDTHFAFLGLPSLHGRQLTIHSLSLIHPPSTRPGVFLTLRVRERLQSSTPSPFSGSPAFRWYLMLRDRVPGSSGRSFQEQEALLPREYEVPTAIEELVKQVLIAHRQPYRSRKDYVRCREATCPDTYPIVGNGQDERPITVAVSEDSGEVFISIAASRKPALS